MLVGQIDSMRPEELLEPPPPPSLQDVKNNGQETVRENFVVEELALEHLELALEHLEFIVLGTTPKPMGPYLSELVKHYPYLTTLNQNLDDTRLNATRLAHSFQLCSLNLSVLAFTTFF
ncbi:hypothetical protein EC957_005932 [Mortierella hygrophila]|uniref:Uncharacterized protein n=1 Tax=Mortierella hygrophila TaxID=979708 RepID=A0A9P6K6L4_9FUNG|nr:hypothetical protein EC957_005932 [Mortierella hygrophila]